MGGSASKEPEVEKESKGEDAENLAAEQDKHKNVKLTKKDKEDMDKFKVTQELDEGPISNRKCTDCLFSIVFIAGIVAMFAAAIYGWSKGKPDQLLIGWDSDQNGCGYSEKTQDYPYLYWPQMPDSAMIKQIEEGNYDDITQLLNYGVCVKECPASTTDKVQCYPTKHMTESMPDNYEDCEYYPEESGIISPTPFRYQSKSFVSHFCIPDGDYADSAKMKDAFREAFFSSVVGNKGTQYFYDIYKSWAVILVASICSILIAYAYLFILRALGGIIIWATIALTFIVLIATGFYSYFYAKEQYATDDPSYEYCEYGGYVAWGLAGLLLVTLCCCMGAIQLGIAVFKCTAEYIQKNMVIFALPAAASILSLIWYVIWISAAIFIFSVGTPTARENYPYITEIKWSDQTRYIMIYHVFALLWINAFIIGCVQFIIGASTCLWYFTCKTDTEGRGTIGTATKWLFRYHWASIALGSLIIAICQMIRLIFEYYRKKMGMLEKTNVAIKILVVCTGYCLWCLEKCVKYISKNAYIQIALTNDSFLQAAINAFTLILKNAHRFGFANTIGTVYMTFGCFFIAATTSFGTYAFMTNYDGLDVTSPIPTTVVMGIIAVMVGYQFLSIFSFSSDAILQSFLLDEELRRPSNASRPDDMQAFHDSMTAKLSRALCGCR